MQAVLARRWKLVARIKRRVVGIDAVHPPEICQLIFVPVDDPAVLLRAEEQRRRIRLLSQLYADRLEILLDDVADRSADHVAGDIRELQLEALPVFGEYPVGARRPACLCE